MRTAVSHISCVLSWSGTNFNVYGLWATASLQISCVSNLTRTYGKRFGSMCTASLNISCVRHHHHQVSNNFRRIHLIYLWAKIYPRAVISYQIFLKQPFVTSTTFLSVFLVLKNAPILPSWWMPDNEQKFILDLYFLGLPLFIIIAPLKKFIIIIIP